MRIWPSLALGLVLMVQPVGAMALGTDVDDSTTGRPADVFARADDESVTVGGRSAESVAAPTSRTADAGPTFDGTAATTSPLLPTEVFEAHAHLVAEP